MGLAVTVVAPLGLVMLSDGAVVSGVDGGGGL